MNEQKQSKRWIGYLLLAVMAAAFLYRGCLSGCHR